MIIHVIQNTKTKGEKVMKKKLFTTIAVMSLCTMALVGCKQKAVCDFCGETKMCTEKTVEGEKINICDDCQKEINDIFN